MLGTNHLILQDAKENKDAPKKRLGRLLTFTLGRKGRTSASVLQQHDAQDMPAVLDMKWCHCPLQDTAVLGVANAAGELRLHGLQQGVDTVQCSEQHCVSVGEDRLVLSLDWSTGRFDTAAPGVVVSDSKGEVGILQVDQSRSELLQQWKAHDYEAWIAAYDYWQPSVIYSGELF